MQLKSIFLGKTAKKIANNVIESILKKLRVSQTLANRPV